MLYEREREREREREAGFSYLGHSIYYYRTKYYSKRLLTAQKAKFSIKDFFSKCDQIRRKLRIWSHLLQKSLMENFIFCVSERGNPSLNIREGACYQGFTNVVIRDFATRIRER